MFTNTYLPSANGVATSIDGFRTGLTELGHEVFVVAPGAADLRGDDRVLLYPSVRLPTTTDYRLALPWPYCVRSALRTLDIDIVHTHHPWWVGRWGLSCARECGVPALTTVHTQYEHQSRRVPFHQATVRRIIRRQTLAYCQDVDLVLTPGGARQDELRRLGVTTPIEVVPNATDTAPFAEASGHGVRGQLGVGTDRRVILFVGRLTQGKRVDVLLGAMKDVLLAAPDTLLMVVGDGDELDDLQAAAQEMDISEHVVFAGRVAPDEVPSYCAVADLFATASLHEVQPVSITEAMAAGTPVVAPDVDWARSVLENGQTGLLADRDAAGLAKCIIELLGDDRLRSRMSKHAIAQARRHDIIPATKRLLQVYRQLIEDPVGSQS
jgi:glycosyltransferase involved in cell wall biosynthesis